MVAERSEGGTPMPDIPGVLPPLPLKEAQRLFDDTLQGPYDPILLGAKIRDLTRSLPQDDPIEEWSVLSDASSRAARYALLNGDGETARRYFDDAQAFHSGVEERLY